MLKNSLKKPVYFRTVLGLAMLATSTHAYAGDDSSVGGRVRSFWNRVRTTVTQVAHTVQTSANNAITTLQQSSQNTASSSVNSDSNSSDSSVSTAISPDAAPTDSSNAGGSTLTTTVPPTNSLQAPAQPAVPSSPARANEVPNACSTVGPQRIAVIIANYDGAPSDTVTADKEYIRELFVGATHNYSVADYYKTVSKGKTWFETVTVLGPYHMAPFTADLSINAAVYKSLDAMEANLLAQAGNDVDLTQIDRVVFLTPNAIQPSGQSIGMGAGMAAQGVCDMDTVNAQGVHHRVARAWVRSSKVYLGASTDRISTDPTLLAQMGPDAVALKLNKLSMGDMAPIIHELGHTFGLGHANEVNRPSTGFQNQFQNDEILPAANAIMYESSYADPFSAMGSNQVKWFNAAHLSQLNWLDNNQVPEIRADGVYRIYPLESNDGNLKGLKIPRVIQGPNESTVSNLWVEFRKPSTVYDIDLAMDHETNGAIVHYTNPKQAGPNSDMTFETVLLNFQPAHQLLNQFQTDFTLKGAWKDDHSMVKLEVVSQTADYIDVKVSFDDGLGLN